MAERMPYKHIDEGSSPSSGIGSTIALKLSVINTLSGIILIVFIYVLTIFIDIYMILYPIGCN